MSDFTEIIRSIGGYTLLDSRSMVLRPSMRQTQNHLDCLTDPPLSVHDEETKPARLTYLRRTTDIKLTGQGNLLFIEQDKMKLSQMDKSKGLNYFILSILFILSLVQGSFIVFTALMPRVHVPQLPFVVVGLILG